jgi:glycosyltransferase involved in cell wall biosynthesis
MAVTAENHDGAEITPRPRVSVGLPVYNGENYLVEALDSLLAQTFTDFELIISDNASTDRTEDICCSYALRDPRIRYHRQTENRGGMWNFNEVFRLARGVYFKWAAHDDVCEPPYLARCMEILDSRPEVVWCYAQSAKIDRGGRLLQEDPEEAFGPAGITHSSQGGFPRQGHDAVRPSDRFQGVLLGCSWAVDFFGVIRTEVLRRTHLMPLCYGGEKVLTAELSLYGPSYEVSETLLLTRIHPAASGNNPSAAAQGSFVNPRPRHRWEATRLKLLRGYIRAVQHAPLPLRERLRCWWAIFKYVSQVRKWGRVVGSLVSGMGVGSRKAKSDCVRRAAEKPATLAAPPSSVALPSERPTR